MAELLLASDTAIKLSLQHQLLTITAHVHATSQLHTRLLLIAALKLSA